MKVLHILDHSVPVTSGYAFRSRSIIRTQAILGVTPIVLTSPRQQSVKDDIEIIEGIPHYRTAPRPPRRSPLGDMSDLLTMARRITAVARHERPAVLHAHSSLLNGLPALWAGRRLGLPVVYEVRAFWEDAAVDHGTTHEGSIRYRMIRALESVVFRRAHRVVVICDGMRQDIVGRGVSSSRIITVPNGVDTERFQPQPRSARVRERYGLNGAPVVGFIGSFYRYEGLRFLLEAFGDLRRAIPATRLLLVGGGEDEVVITREAAKFPGGVVMTGSVPHADVADFHSAIDVFVCPRLRMRLTELVTPLKPLEAMAMARAVLASDVGGLAELIDHGRTGVLFPAGSIEGFVSAATRMLRDQPFRERLGKEARAFVERERTWESIVPRYLSLYAELTRGR
jgi:PEP-CTERM/exosortase A-associated glycosyltransferase